MKGVHLRATTFANLVSTPIVRRRFVRIAVVGAVLVALVPAGGAGAQVSGGPVRAASAASASAFGDFNDDGYDDLAVGVPSEDIDGLRDVGVIQVFYGGSGGLGVRGTEIVYQGTPFIEGHPEAGDRFGAAVTAGDFDGDGIDDVAVGVPGEDHGNIVDAGIVHIIRGSKSGLTSANDRLVSQATAGGANEAGDQFGYAVAAGDFDNDGDDDLVASAPYEDVDLPGPLPLPIGGSTVADAGEVAVVYGGAGEDFAAMVNLWNEDVLAAPGGPEADDHFGLTLAVGDFNGNDHDDLAIGAPDEDDFNLPSTGRVTVLYGRAGNSNPILGFPPGLSEVNAEYWAEDPIGEAPLPADRVSGTPAAADFFGAALAAGDFNNDGRDDLAVGVPGQDVGPNTPLPNGGAVNILSGIGPGTGDPGGLDGANNPQWVQRTSNPEQFNAMTNKGGAEAQDFFGLAVAAGDLNGDSYDDLIVGVPFEDIGSIADAGAVNVLLGRASGLSASGDQMVWQGSSGLKGGPERDDAFGTALATGDFNSAIARNADLAVGIPSEDLGSVGDAGMVQVIDGGPGGLTAEDKLIYQGLGNVGGNAEFGDNFGAALG